jgi:REP element-mobilizing transposase RayT
MDDRMKDIVISSLQFLVSEGRVKVYGFVLMPNHIHVICLPRHTCGGKFKMIGKSGKCSKAS